MLLSQYCLFINACAYVSVKRQKKKKKINQRGSYKLNPYWERFLILFHSLASSDVIYITEKYYNVVSLKVLFKEVSTDIILI